MAGTSAALAVDLGPLLAADRLDLGRAIVSSGQAIERIIPWPPSICSGGVTPSRSLGTPICIRIWIARFPWAELWKKATTRGMLSVFLTSPGRTCGVSMAIHSRGRNDSEGSLRRPAERPGRASKFDVRAGRSQAGTASAWSLESIVGLLP